MGNHHIIYLDRYFKIIKNRKNKGTFICRNLGALQSKGEYLIFPDPDDILSQDIIDIGYKYLKKYNFEMLRFNIYVGKGNILLNKIAKQIQNRPIFQPELSTYIFYCLGKLLITDYNIANKFVKRVSFIRVLNFLNNYYLKIYMVGYEDQLINFFLYRTVKTFYFLKKIGYYYIRNKKNINETQITRKTQTLKFQFLYLKIVFESTKNTLYEKDISNAILNSIINQNISIVFSDENFKFYIDIINMHLNCPFINLENKNYLSNIKNLINNKIQKNDKLKVLF